MNVVATTESLTAIHLAARRGDEEIVQLLIEHGADLSAEAKEVGMLGTPLDVAIFNGNEGAAELLRQHGAPEGSGRSE